MILRILREIKTFIFHAEPAELWEAQSDEELVSNKIPMILRILREKIIQ